MKIKVLGMDPSLRNWGLALGFLDLATGVLSDLRLELIQPKEETSKQVRKNSKDLEIARLLAEGLSEFLSEVNAVFVEVPVGSQSARAMASYGICVGILGAIQATGVTLIEVSPSEVKMALANSKTATKEMMIQRAMALYPDANFPRHRGQVTSKAEHVADAIGAIHAGVKTPLFKQFMKLHTGNKQ